MRKGGGVFVQDPRNREGMVDRSTIWRSLKHRLELTWGGILVLRQGGQQMPDEPPTASTNQELTAEIVVRVCSA